jgi:hypothetical protein
MSNAPKDGTPVRLHLRDGSDIVGYYTARWWGWVPLLDPWPLIRGDIRFAGWEPIGDKEVQTSRPERWLVATSRGVPQPVQSRVRPFGSRRQLVRPAATRRSPEQSATDRSQSYPIGLVPLF